MKANASVFCLLFILVLTPGARADDPPSPDATPTVNPQVVDKLIDMGNYLRGLPAFQVDAEVSRDTVLEPGQKNRTNINNSTRNVNIDNSRDVDIDVDGRGAMATNTAYLQCGSTWYQPQYQGSDVTYVVVNAP